MIGAEAQDDTEASPGPMLRRAREARGFSEQKAAEELNLDAATIVALERDDLAALGAPVFAKGHLRRYGALLGIADDALLAAYQRAQGRPEAPTLVPAARRERLPERAGPRWPWIAGGLVLFAAAGAIAAYVSEYGLHLPSAAIGTDAPASKTSPLDAAAADDGLIAAAAGQPVTVAAGDGPVAASATDTVRPAVPPGHVGIGLAFAADSWAEVYDASGQAILYDLGRAGTERGLAAAAPLSVTLGNAAAVALTVGGRPATIPATSGGGTVARFSVDADGTVR